MKPFNVIAAVSLNGVIGDSEQNVIPWHIPADLKYFKSVTNNKTVVMGSKTFYSIGKPLKDRHNVVISRAAEARQSLKDNFKVDQTFSNFVEAHKNCSPDFFVIGGEHIYQDAIRLLPKHLYITVVKIDCGGDVRFPIIGSRFLNDVVYTHGGAAYNCIRRSSWLTENGYDFQFTVFEINE